MLTLGMTAKTLLSGLFALFGRTVLRRTLCGESLSAELSVSFLQERVYGDSDSLGRDKLRACKDCGKWVIQLRDVDLAGRI